MTTISHFLPNGIKADNNQIIILTELEMLEQFASLQPHWWQRLQYIYRRRSYLNRSIYIYGKVGRGKTMLMNAFCNFCQHKNISVVRFHLHDFLEYVQSKLHDIRQRETANPLEKIADYYKQQFKIICLDECDIHDIADAMLLRNFFPHLWQSGVLTVMTSNNQPDDLYQDGLQRQEFLPFINNLKQYNSVLSLDTDVDYRSLQNLQHTHFFNNYIRFEIKATEYQQPQHYHFDELCVANKGRRNYQRLLLRQHDPVFISHIPRFYHDNKDACRRFITLIDMLYDAKHITYLHSEFALREIDCHNSLAPIFKRTASRLMHIAKNYQ